jgi:hypothetical protein
MEPVIIEAYNGPKVEINVSDIALETVKKLFWTNV